MLLTLNPQPSTIARQRSLLLPIADDVRLVDVNTARASLGLIAKSVTELVEDRKLVAFDLTAGEGTNRSLRIWSQSLVSVGNSKFEIHNAQFVVADCLLCQPEHLMAQPDFRLWSSALERMWSLSNQVMLRLIGSNEIQGVRVGRNWKVLRTSAALFLRRRLQ